jgi:hypothetical protein
MEPKTSRRRAIGLLALAPLLALLHAGRTVADQASVLSSEAAVGMSPQAVSNTAPDLTDTISDPAVDPTPSVSDTVSGATDTVSDVASGATGSVSGATGSASGTTGSVSGTTGTVSGAAGSTSLDATSGAGPVAREGSTRMAVGASGGTGGSSASGDSQDIGRCDPQTSTCIGGASDGALADAVERILGFLAQTGLPLAGWIAVAVGLGLLGTLLLLRTRRGTGKAEPQGLRTGSSSPLADPERGRQRSSTMAPSDR